MGNSEPDDLCKLLSWTSRDLETAMESIDVRSLAETGSKSQVNEEPQSGIYESIGAFFREQLSSDALNSGAVSHPLRGWGEAFCGMRLGRFELKELVDHGGFGIVFRAFDAELERFVALKIPRPELLARPEASNRLLHEARLAASLRHPGVVQVYDVGSLGPVIYIASEFCDGENLHHWLARQDRPLTPRTAATMAMDIADAVGFAHSRGLVHQDLKPSNVLVECSADLGNNSNSTVLRITDFGLAFYVSHHRGVEVELLGGTRAYMAPEQLDENITAIGTHTDVFALGLVLRDLLKDRTHHSDAGACGTSPQHECCESGCVGETNGRLPPDLVAILRKCVSHEPADRYRDAIALRDDLGRYLRGEPVDAMPVGLFGSAYRAARRRPLVSMLSAALLLAIAGSMVGITYMYFRERTLRAIAQSRQDEARKAVSEMYTEVAEKWLVGDGRLDPLQRDFLLKSLSYYEKWAREDQDEPNGQYHASVAWHRVANMHARLEDTPAAVAARQRCLALLDKLLERDPANPEYRFDHFYNLLVLGPEYYSLARRTDTSASDRCALEAYEEIRSLVREYPDNVAYQDAFATASRLAGTVFHHNGKPNEAQNAYAIALKLGRKLVDSHPEDPKYLSNVAASLDMLRQLSGNHPEQAVAYGDEAIAILTRLTTLFPRESSYAERLGENLVGTASLHITRGELTSAKEQLDQTTDLYRDLCTQFPRRLGNRVQQTSVLYELGRLAYFEGNSTKAHRLVSRALSELETLRAQHPSDVSCNLCLARILENSPVEVLRNKRRAKAILEELAAMPVEPPTEDAPRSIE